MRHWLVRVDAPSIKMAPGNKALVITSKRQPNIKAGDVIVLMTKVRQKGVFSKYTTVSGVEVSKVKKLPGEITVKTKVFLTGWESLSNTDGSSSEVDVFNYSLTFVRNLLRPNLHFRRGYRILPVHDFETIQRGEAFVARTGYFELLNALPVTMRKKFLGEELLSTSSNAFVARLSRLNEFINIRVLSVGSLLSELNSVIRETSIQDEDGNLPDHLFVDGTAENNQTARSDGDNIFIQEKLFNDLNQSLKKPLSEEILGDEDFDTNDTDVLAQILIELKKPARRLIEQRFENLFKAAS